MNNLNAGANDTALDLRVQAGEAPMRVNSDARVPNLNADKLDGKDPADLARSGLGSNTTSSSVATFTDRASVTVNAPGKGFVVANGAVSAYTSSSSCNPCYAHAEILNPTTNERSPALVGSLGNGTTSTHTDVLATTWVFPVDPGDNTFQLRTGPFPSGAAIDFRNPRVSAVYVPYGPNDATGTASLAPSSKLASPTGEQWEESPDGTMIKK